MIKRRVLIVDDQMVNRKLLGKILSQEYEILYAGNGQEALELMKSDNEISAVLLDIVMPVMNGYEVLKSMMEDSRLSKIPVIVSSQKDGDEDEIKALSLGAYDFIAKPYKADIIRHRVKNTIRLRETASMVNKTERDSLTGLYNKQFFLDKVRECLQNNPKEKYDMLCLGVERFKLINETYGEEEGNKVLCYIAKVMEDACQKIQICGRFSADEFYALIPHRDVRSKREMYQYYDKVNEYAIDMEIKIHCGIYAFQGDEKSISNVCDRAKLAADSNRGKYDDPVDYYNDSMRQKLMEEQFITSQMYGALEKKQFEVFYQPKYDLEKETMAGAEALVRWRHPDKGFLSPGAFVPIFERNGFITHLDRYVWENVCQDIREWIDKGYPPLSVSVNVSRADIYNPKLTKILLDLVEQYQIPMQYLHLEITESAYTDNPDQIISVVSNLRSRGFIIEMDDFGSGYSSLNMLAQMPVDVLKLDMKFVQMESDSKSGKGIMSFVISLAKWLNLVVVAEGVETGEQIASLRSMECNYVQGFYYAKPMPKAEFEQLLGHAEISEMLCPNHAVDDILTEVKEKEEPEEESDFRVMLIVDDIEVNRAVIASCFYGKYTIVEKQNGKEAWEYLEDHVEEVDVVLLDLLMPVMDGFQLLGKIREKERMKDLPVIITSQGDVESEHKALLLQADDFISKPYRTDLICHRVKNVVESYRYRKLKNQSFASLFFSDSGEDSDGITKEEKVHRYIQAQKSHFDIVRLVDPKETQVCSLGEEENCDHMFCYSVWGKQTRCSNCISLKAWRKKGRCNKLEYSQNTLYFVISEYVPYKEKGAVVEMVTKLDSDYVDNVFQKDLLYMNIDNLHKQLEFDELTGIYNRRHIDQYLPKYIENARLRKKNIGLAMIDIDSFKGLNDTFGHLAGDEALRYVAGLLQTNIALSKGDFVARFGGDEFLIVCRDIPSDVFEERLQKVIELIHHIPLRKEATTEIGVSIGCVNSEEFPEFTVSDLIRRADERLYSAKHSGKGCLVAGD